MLYDSWGYWRIAENLDLYGIFSQGENGPLIPDSSRTPVYPLFICLLKKTFLGFYGIIIFQIIISSAICSLTSLFTEQIFNKRAGIIAGFFLAFDFPSIFFANTIMTETLFAILLLISFYFFISFLKNQKHQSLILSAIFLGLSILCRPIAVYLPIIFSGTILFFTYPVRISSPGNSMEFRFQKLKKSFTFLLISYLVIAPWLIRNYRTFGSPFLSTISETNMLLYTDATIRAENENKSIFQIQNEYKEFSAKNFNWNNPEEIIRFSKYCKEESVRVILENPITFFKKQSFSFIYFFIKPLRNYIDLQLGITKKYNSITGFTGKNLQKIPEKTFENSSIFTLCFVIFQIILLLSVSFFSITYFFSKKGKLFLFPAIILVIIFYFAFLSTFTEVDARMRVPVMAFLCIIAGGGASLFFSEPKKNKK